MFARISWTDGMSRDVLEEGFLDFESAREYEFWFGRSLVWTSEAEHELSLNVSVMVDSIAVVGRRHEARRNSRVGYTEPFAYSGSAFLGATLGRLLGKCRTPELQKPILTHVSVSAFERSEILDRLVARLFLPQGYDVTWEEVGGGVSKLRLVARKASDSLLQELSALFTVLDRRTGWIADPLEGDAMHRPKWLRGHPAEEGILEALRGHHVPLRRLLPIESSFRTNHPIIAPGMSLEPVPVNSELSSELISKIVLVPSQIEGGSHAWGHFNVDTRWLLYLPPGMVSIQNQVGYDLESPHDALAYYRDQRIARAVVEFKHMGSRGIVVLCRNEEAALKRFGVEGQVGCVYTRNGRAFFSNPREEAFFLARLRRTLDQSAFWDRFRTNWVCFDGEILPWSFKADALEKSHDPMLCTIGEVVLHETNRAVDEGASGPLWDYWLRKLDQRSEALLLYRAHHSRLREQPHDVESLQFAPFHLIATEGRSYFQRSHHWHMEVLTRLGRRSDGFFLSTPFRTMSLKGDGAWREITEWWRELAASGAEGLVVKPMHFIPRGRRGLCQPAIKCRTPAHLRLVYGPGYEVKENIEQLRARRALINRRNKHRRVLRQFALGIEAVQRFVAGRRLPEVHECLIGVVALETAPATEPP